MNLLDDTDFFKGLILRLVKVKTEVQSTISKTIPLGQEDHIKARPLFNLAENTNIKFEKLIDKLNGFLKSDKYYLGEDIDLNKSVFEIENLRRELYGNSDLDYIYNVLIDINSKLEVLDHSIEASIGLIKFEDYKDEAEKSLMKIDEITGKAEEKLKEANLISERAKNKDIFEIYNNEYKKFQKIALYYEVSFYLLVLALGMYFFGYSIDFNTEILKFKFAESIHANLDAAFYVQKISLLIISTTTAAFLLKRSFMCRRLAEEAYRTAKEFDGLPLFIETLPKEMKEKIRFDLTYKYFGNGIHNESYTGGENLMHENIKANTDFIKAVKDLTSKVEVPKADKAPKDAA